MWTCPKCGRAFKRQNQNHFCSHAPATVDEYIASLPEEQAVSFLGLIQIIRGSFPETLESIKWGMPSFKLGGGEFQAAAYKNFISFYVGDKTLELLGQELEGYKGEKGTIYFPYDKPIEKELIIKAVNILSAPKIYEYDGEIIFDPDSGGAYIKFPWDIQKELGKGRVKVKALFDGEEYRGSIVNMGVKNDDGSIAYIIGITKAVREKISKGEGDRVHVKIEVL